MRLIISLSLALLTILAINLLRTYKHIPVKELKRRARRGDELAAALFRATTYGPSLSTVLWLFIGITSAGFFVYVARTLPFITALLASVALVWLGFVWLPAAKVTKASEQIASFLAPAIAKLVYYLHGPIDVVVRFIRKHRPVHFHTGLYERSDLIDLLNVQKVQADNRIEQAELEIARHAISFGDKTINEVMTPRRVVKMVSVDDDLGPVLMTELHKSGHSRFPVYEGKEDVVVGTLFMRDLINRRSGGKVRNAMKKRVFYLHEDQSLHDALQAIFKTHNHMFIVVNSFEEYVGIITMEDVLEQIVGQQIMDEFDQYEDLRAVAARAAKVEHHEHVTQEEKHTENIEKEQESAVIEPQIVKPSSKKSVQEVDDTIELD